LAELGSLASAKYAIYAELGGLGDAHVIYLKLVDVAARREVRSTVLELGAKSDQKAEASAAMTRLLAPESYVGTLAIKGAVKGARVYLDGHLLPLGPAKEQPVFVGSHALRITHPEYRDYVRFVDIHFQQRAEIEATLVPLPSVSRSLKKDGTSANATGDTVLVEHEAPWYKQWYTIAGGAVAVAILSGVIVGLAADGVDSDAIRQLR
jgi:hypothetical protein